MLSTPWGGQTTGENSSEPGESIWEDRKARLDKIYTIDPAWKTRPENGGFSWDFPWDLMVIFMEV